MKISYKIPAFAPEQGKIYVNGKTFAARGFDFYNLAYCTPSPSDRIRKIRKALFAPQRQGKYFTVRKTYENPENSWLNDIREGFGTYAQALDCKRMFEAGAIEGARVTIQSRIIG